MMIFNHKNGKVVFQSLKISKRLMTIFWNHDLTWDIALLID